MIKVRPTKGEKFKAKRRRDKLSLEQCAEKLGIKVITIKVWEEGTPATPHVNIKLTRGEEYRIIRERLGLTLKEVYTMIGISKVTMIKLEKAEKGQKVLKDFYAKYIKANRITIFK